MTRYGDEEDQGFNDAKPFGQAIRKACLNGLLLEVTCDEFTTNAIFSNGMLCNIMTSVYSHKEWWVQPLGNAVANDGEQREQRSKDK